MAKELTALEEFKLLGYIVQVPNAEGAFYYMVKQANKGARQIFIKPNKVNVEVQVLENYKKTKLTAREAYLLEKFVLEDLGASSYSLKEKI